MRNGSALLLVVAVLVASACSKSSETSGGGGGTTAQNQGGFSREQYLQLEIDTDCGWIKASGEPKDREKARDEALTKLGKTRNDYNLSKGAFMGDKELRSQIDGKVSDCYKAAGFEQVDDPNGEVIWEKAGP